jgi:hypothetical protein
MKALNDGRTVYAIAKALDAEGLPSRTGKPWAAVTVRRILGRVGQ